MNPKILLPAFCPTCGSVFPSGFAMSEGGTAIHEGNRSGPCPKGHMGIVLDGTYTFFDGLLKLARSGPGSETVIARIRDLAYSAKEDPSKAEDALKEVLQYLPPESAAAVASFGNSPIVTLMFILYLLTCLTSVGANIATVVSGIKSDPQNGLTINTVTITENYFSLEPTLPEAQKKLNRHERRKAEKLNRKNRKTKPGSQEGSI